MRKATGRKLAIIIAAATLSVFGISRLKAAREAAIDFSSGPFGLATGQVARLGVINDGDVSNAPPVQVKLSLFDCRKTGPNGGPHVVSSTQVTVGPGECASLDLPADGSNLLFDQTGRVQLWAMVTIGVGPGGGCVHASVEVFDLQGGRTTAVIPLSQVREAANRD